nr:2Fe-2S iron-sulfur cluster-binding protein [Nostoc piscinale]
MEVIFKVIRQQQNSLPMVQTYPLEVEPGNTILDCLNRIKWEQDGTLAFRKKLPQFSASCYSCKGSITGHSTPST